MSETFIRVYMPDGTVWDIAASFIAHNKADYYQSRGGSWTAEYQEAMKDQQALLEWASNNIRWDDIREYAEKVDVGGSHPNYEVGWLVGEKEVVERYGSE